MKVKKGTKGGFCGIQWPAGEKSTKKSIKETPTGRERETEKKRRAKKRGRVCRIRSASL